MNKYYLKPVLKSKTTPALGGGQVVQGADLLGSSVEGWGCQSHPSEAGEVGPSLPGAHKQKWK